MRTSSGASYSLREMMLEGSAECSSQGRTSCAFLVREQKRHGTYMFYENLTTTSLLEQVVIENRSGQELRASDGRVFQNGTTSLLRSRDLEIEVGGDLIQISKIQGSARSQPLGRDLSIEVLRVQNQTIVIIEQRGTASTFGYGLELESFILSIELG